MKSIPLTPLETWITQKIGRDRDHPLTCESLARYQVDKINATLGHACRNSPFYKRLFGRGSAPMITHLEELSQLPFTLAEDIRADSYRFLCVSQDRIARVVTLRTSGTTNHPKRCFFTNADLELTIDFFHHGMSTLVQPGQKVLILMPGESPGSVGDLLVRGLARMNVRGIPHGLVRNYAAAADVVLNQKIDCLVGLPSQVMALARGVPGSHIGSQRIKSVLLSADSVPKIVVSEIERIWGCKVFQHYGMTESGLGGGVECQALDGYHLREADLYYEIVNPDNGHPAPIGDVGEVVFTTLTRQGMPLIRYRTGDLASFIKRPCPCGSMLRRMRPVMGRIGDRIRLKNAKMLGLPELDEAILALRAVQDYAAVITERQRQDHLRLKICAHTPKKVNMRSQIHQALMAIPAVQDAMRQGLLGIDIVVLDAIEHPPSSAVKRRIVDKR